MITSLALQLNFILQALPDGGGNWFQYGIAGALVALMIMILKYIIQRDKHDQIAREKRDDALELQRTELRLKENEARDEKFLETIADLKEFLAGVDKNYKEISTQFITTNKDAIDKFVSVINEQSKQTSYTVQVLTELKYTINELRNSNKTDFELMKNAVLDKLAKLGVYYEIRKKDKEDVIKKDKEDVIKIEH